MSNTPASINFFVFGASGDLARLKIFPALYQLFENRLLPAAFNIVGFARTSKAREDFQQEFAASVHEHIAEAEDNLLTDLLTHVHYYSGNYDVAADYAQFHDFVQTLPHLPDTIQIAYLSVPPVAYKEILQNLAVAFAAEKAQLRLVIEKPFGYNQESATELYHSTASTFPETQIYPLDHYLGKTAVQSILNLRHSNRILNLMMKGAEIANIQISVLEPESIRDRIGYFDHVGTIKDMIQSHILQVLALITMSIPIAEAASSLHREKNAILSALSFDPMPGNLVLGQYRSYRDNAKVAPSSNTETFAAIRLTIDRESWHDVPIYVRSGKLLNKDETSVMIELKKFAYQKADEEPNRLLFEIAPQGRLSFGLINKHGIQSQYEQVRTTDTIGCRDGVCLSEHALLLVDVIKGEKRLFVSFEEIIAAWRLVDQILAYQKASQLMPEIYEDGSRGPQSQDRLPQQDGFEWFEF